jgi:hypothetical protein
MEQNRLDDSLKGFFKWMDELNEEAVRRGYAGWPLQAETAHSRNCWIVDFGKGLTPAQALDADNGEIALVPNT